MAIKHIYRGVIVFAFELLFNLGVIGDVDVGEILCFFLMYYLFCMVCNSKSLYHLNYWESWCLFQKQEKRMVKLHCMTKLLLFDVVLREFTFQVFICKYWLLFQFHLIWTHYISFHFLKETLPSFYLLQSCLQVWILRNGEAGIW